MAEVTGDNYNNYTWAGGGYGNLIAGDSVVHECAAVAIADTIKMGRLPVGAILVGFIMVNDALGAASTVAIGTRVDGAAIVPRVAAAATNAAGDAVTHIHPVAISTESDIVVTIAGGVATGTLSIIPLYINRGN